MEIVHVHVRVKDECIEEFKLATIANALQSRREPGVARFEILQQRDEPSRFVLVEIYRTAEAPGAHKETKHYQAWRDAVAPMMADARSSLKFNELSAAGETAQPKGLPG
jgi:autoinducer 2-degrading protein